MRFLTILLLSCTLFSLAHAEPASLKPFTSGSYQQIVSSHAGKPFFERLQRTHTRLRDPLGLVAWHTNRQIQLGHPLGQGN